MARLNQIYRTYKCIHSQRFHEKYKNIEWFSRRDKLGNIDYYQLLVPCAKTATRQRRAFSIFPLLVPPPGMGMDSPWKYVSCLKIMKVHFAGCLRLICIAVVGLGAPLSRFLEGAPYKFLNE